MTTASGSTAPVAVSASAPRRRRATVTRPSVKMHHHGHHRRGLRSHAAAPATPTSSKAVTREECYAFVRSGCKPKESFRYVGREMRCAMRRGRDVRRRHVDSFRGFGL